MNKLQLFTEYYTTRIGKKIRRTGKKSALIIPTEISNLVPRVSPLHTPGSERGETLVGAGHVSPKIWEITNKCLEGGAVECQFAHTKCTRDGKTCPSEDQLAESYMYFKGHVKWSSRNP